MNEQKKTFNLSRKIFWGIIIPSLVILFVFVIAFRAWNIDFTAPVLYAGGDDLAHGSYIARAMKGDLYVWTDSHRGYPYGEETYSFPAIPWCAVIWGYIVGLLTSSYAFAINSYYILGFCACGFIFSYVARKLGISYGCALIGGILYAFPQFHAIHGIGHLTASSYFAVPLVVMICIWTMTKEKWDINKSDKIVIFLSCFLICVSDLFYAFWGCMIIFLCGLFTLFRKKYTNFIVSIIAIAGIAVITGILLSPAIIHSFTAETSTAQRTAADAYYWGLKLVSLIIPWMEGHPLSFLKTMYVENSLPAGENLWNYMGIFAIFGLIFMVISVFRMEKDGKENNIIKSLMYINTWIMLIGVSGGLGTAVALLITSKVRVYNRIFVYIYCVCILAFLFLLNRIFEKYRLKKKGYIIVACIMISLHLFDMQYLPITNLNSETWPYNRRSSVSYHSDEEFVARLEEILLDEAKILYLPYIGYPENKSETGAVNYTRGDFLNIFSEKFYSSFGITYGTKEAEFMAEKYLTDDIGQILFYAVPDEFDAILVDYNLLLEPEILCRKIEGALGYQSILKNENYEVFLINDVIRSQYQNTVDKINWGEGFYSKESDNTSTWNWADKRAVLSFESLDTENLVFSFGMSGFGNSEREVRVIGCGVDEVFLINQETTEVRLTLDLSQGKELTFISSVDSTVPETEDNRELNFRVSNLKLWENYE